VTVFALLGREGVASPRSCSPHLRGAYGLLLQTPGRASHVAAGRQAARVARKSRRSPLNGDSRGSKEPEWRV